MAAPAFSRAHHQQALHHTKGRNLSHIADNKLDRKFTPEKPNTVFVSDVTEFRVAGRKVYLSPVMDLFDRSIVAHTVATSPSTAFTAASLAKAIAVCAPEPGWMMHTDQGFQYQHLSWRNLIGDNGGVHVARGYLVTPW